jgi:glycosyltransferase involved in cell wall biosynthesis
MNSLVTVIIPVYNCAAYIAEAVDSALAQEGVATEIVVVNDGSTDNTLGILAGFGDRIRVIDQKNAGPPAARNAGLAAARGDYIAFLDADDVWIQGKLAAQVRHLDRYADVGTIFTNWHVWNPEADGSFARRPDIEACRVSDEVDVVNSGWLYNRLLFDCEMLTTTVMLRGSMVRQLGGFDLSLFNGDDYDYWLRASRAGKITKLASVGALYRILPNSVSRKPRDINFEYEVVSRAASRFGLVGPDGTTTAPADLQRRLEALELAHGYVHLLRGDPRVAYSAFRGALARDPARPRLWLNAMRARVKLLRRSADKTGT